MPDYTPRHPLPDPEVWDCFCDAVSVASQMLAGRVPAQPPVERLSSAQFACGKYFAAMDELLRALRAPREVRDLVALPASAWHRASWGFPDPLLAVPRFAHSPGADPTQILFRAAIVKLIAELVAEGMTLHTAAEFVAGELQAQQASQMPDVRTLERWYRQATKQPDSRVAVAYEWFRPRLWPPSAGVTLAERLRWIIPASRP